MNLWPAIIVLKEAIGIVEPDDVVKFLQMDNAVINPAIEDAIKILEKHDKKDA